MKIVVCIKQVPDTADITWTENNTIQREGMESIINPFDEYALETALRIKDTTPGAKVYVISMGPPQAQEILKKAIALGADEAFLVSDRKFAGADTVATSKTLAGAIREKIGDYDLIICGQFATDGDTAQTGPSIAFQLDIPQVTYVKGFLEVTKDYITVEKEIETGVEKLKMRLPGLICMLKCDYEPRIAYINGYIKAHDTDVPTYSMLDIGLKPEEVGMSGSPTYVSAAFRPEQKSGGEIVRMDSPREYAMFLNQKIKQLGESDGE